MHFEDNVYYDLSKKEPAGFPCSPDAKRSWLSAPSCLLANTTQTIVSGNGQIIAGFNSTGFFNLQHKSGAVLWSAPIGSPSASMNFTINEACIQFDAQFVIFERGTPNRVLWAADKASSPGRSPASDEKVPKGPFHQSLGCGPARSSRRCRAMHGSSRRRRTCC